MSIFIMVEVRKKEKENVGSLLRRFSERMKKSGVLIEAKKAQAYQKPETRRKRRQSALLRIKRQEDFKVKRRQSL